MKLKLVVLFLLFAASAQAQYYRPYEPRVVVITPPVYGFTRFVWRPPAGYCGAAYRSYRTYGTTQPYNPWVSRCYDALPRRWASCR